MSIRVLAYVTPKSATALTSAESEGALRRVGSLPELARAVVEEYAPCVIIEVPPDGERELAFAKSLARTFDLLEGAVVTDRDDPELRELQLQLFSPEELHRDDFQETLLSRIRENRRKFHRFDWPLQGTLQVDGTATEYQVRSIGAGGAHLESVSPGPPPNTEATITIRFRNFALTTACKVLDSRMPSSKLPPGFAVRFEELSQKAQETIDSIVRDALMDALLNPEDEPEVPSLDADADAFEDPALSMLTM